ncbi:VWA domain-containing protein [Spirosoma sp. KCTC 42546]|uniref:vWA domain-containing protein n=1 Tax=Spirosoma sp. KCTC 42546 TaxID=2520506 RepID=UPI0011596B78|nr:vWA domain-containing protein [Spirosoma sp. KCTC 42546]QDK81909.1 VWA domain-containing protein [Spirosoma sp. KCTC 42546]
MKTNHILLIVWVLLASLTACKHEPDVPPNPIDELPDEQPGTEFMATASMDKGLAVSLTWDAQMGNPTYRILRASANDIYSDPTTMTYQQVGETKEHSFNDTQVNPSSVYYYKVQAQYSASTVVTSIVTVGRTTKPSYEELADVLYTRLGEGTGGKRYDADSPNAVLATIFTIIQEQAGTKGADVVILLDDTGSMGDDIDAVKAGLNKIISALPPSTRLGAATYNDLNELPDSWYNWRDLTTDFASIRTFINAARAYGGGDRPESVYDGIYETLTRVSWTSTKRIMIVVGDDPPLEGSKTKHSYDDVVATCKQKGIEANLYPILIKEDNNKSN